MCVLGQQRFVQVKWNRSSLFLWGTYCKNTAAFAASLLILYGHRHVYAKWTPRRRFLFFKSEKHENLTSFIISSIHYILPLRWLPYALCIMCLPEVKMFIHLTAFMPKFIKFYWQTAQEHSTQNWNFSPCKLEGKNRLDTKHNYIL